MKKSLKFIILLLSLAALVWPQSALAQSNSMKDLLDKQPTNYRSATELHQAFEAYQWITSPEALKAYDDFTYVIENSSFGNLGTDTKINDIQAMFGRTDYTISDQLGLDFRNNYLMSYPYYRPNGNSPFMQLSIPIHDIYAMGATLLFYEVEPAMFKEIDYDFGIYDSVSEFVDITPNIIAISQYFGTTTDVFQLAIPTIHPTTDEQQVSFIIYDNGNIFFNSSMPYIEYRDKPATANYLNYHNYYMDNR